MRSGVRQVSAGGARANAERAAQASLLGTEESMPHNAVLWETAANACDAQVQRRKRRCMANPHTEDAPEVGSELFALPSYYTLLPPLARPPTTGAPSFH